MLSYFLVAGTLLEAKEQKLLRGDRSLHRMFGRGLLCQTRGNNCTAPSGPHEERLITERWASAEVLKRIAQKEYLDKFCWKLRFTNY